MSNALIANRELTAAVAQQLILKGFTHTRTAPPSRHSWFVELRLNPETGELASIATREHLGAFEIRVRNPTTMVQATEDYVLWTHVQQGGHE